MVISRGGSDVEEGLKVAVSSSHVAYVAFEASHDGWEIVALHGRHASKPVDVPQLAALLAPRSGPVTAVWMNFNAHEKGEVRSNTLA